MSDSSFKCVAFTVLHDFNVLSLGVRQQNTNKQNDSATFNLLHYCVARSSCTMCNFVSMWLRTPNSLFITVIQITESFQFSFK